MLQRLLRAALRTAVRLLIKPALSPSIPLAAQRRWSALVSRTVPVAAEVEARAVPELCSGTRATRFSVDGDDPAHRPALLWVHGGGFVLGGRRTHGALASHLAAATGADVYLPEYRKAPEHRFPAAVDDLFEAWKGLLARGHDPARTAIGGDSAGGGLAVLCALTLREMEQPEPAALALISPVTDLALTGESVARNRRSDAMLSPEWVRAGARGFAGELTLTDPKVSPMYAELGGLPPTLIQVTDSEILLDDALRFADRAWGAGVEVELQRFEGLWHDFQLHAGLLDDAAAAVADIGAFLRRRWSA